MTHSNIIEIMSIAIYLNKSELKYRPKLNNNADFFIFNFYKVGILTTWIS